MLSKMVLHIVWVFEYDITAIVQALEVMTISFCLWVVNIVLSMPSIWNTLEQLLRCCSFWNYYFVYRIVHQIFKVIHKIDHVWWSFSQDRLLNFWIWLSFLLSLWLMWSDIILHMCHAVYLILFAVINNMRKVLHIWAV